jgi:hypothetical protein
MFDVETSPIKSFGDRLRTEKFKFQNPDVKANDNGRQFDGIDFFSLPRILNLGIR